RSTPRDFAFRFHFWWTRNTGPVSMRVWPIWMAIERPRSVFPACPAWFRATVRLWSHSGQATLTAGARGVVRSRLGELRHTGGECRTYGTGIGIALLHDQGRGLRG